VFCSTFSSEQTFEKFRWISPKLELPLGVLDKFALQRTATRCNTLQYAATLTCSLVGVFEGIHTATHCNALQHAATLTCSLVGVFQGICTATH